MPSIYFQDTFNGTLDTDLGSHVGESSSAWARQVGTGADFSYQPGFTNNWRLSGAGRVYYRGQGYRPSLYYVAATPSDAEYDIRGSWNALTDPNGDNRVGMVFMGKADGTSNFWQVEYRGGLGWYLTLVTNDAPNFITSWNGVISSVPASVAVEVRIRSTNPRIAVYINGVQRLTSNDATTPGDRIGLWGSNGNLWTETTGLHLDLFSAGGVGYVLPVYGVSGPAAGSPTFASSNYTVSLISGQNPGTLTVTPHVSGIAGTFTPTSVTLADADRTKTFTFTPSAVGTATISFTNGGPAPDPAPMSYVSIWSLPSRVANWYGFWQNFHTGGSTPYLAGSTNPDGSGGYYLDVTDHYDPILVYYMVQDYSIRNGLTPSNWVDQIAAAVTRFRDRAVRADPGLAAGEGYGVQEYHRYATGIVRHYFESATPSELAKGIEAIGYLNKTNFPIYQDYLENYGHPGTYREAAFILNTLIDWELMGRGAHPNLDDAAKVCLHSNVYTSVEGPTRRWGLSIKPFMVGINNWALSRYWERYRNSSDPARVAICDQIPDNIKGICQYMWDVCWYPPGVPVAYEGSTWDKGAIAYKDLALSDPMWTRLLNQDITAVSNRYTFRGPASLSSVDDYYNENKIELIHPTTGNVGDQWLVGDYVGATREFTISASYRPNFDFDASWSFNLIPAAWASLDQDGDRGPEPAMNLMAIFGFAFTYWHQSKVIGDAATAATWRGRAHEMFNGAKQAWDAPFNSKLMHQGCYLAIPALDYLARGDEEWPVATVYSLDPPAAGAAGSVGVSSGPFRITIPHGSRVVGPEKITPAAGSGSLSAPAPILSNDLRMAMFTFTPNVSQDGTTVDVTAIGATLNPDASVAYTVGVGGAPPAPVENYTLTGPTGGEVNQQSSAFTITMRSGVVPGTIRFTPTASTGSGIFIPAYIDLTQSTRVGTFVFIPTSVGARNVSAPDNAGLVDPDAITYTATASTAPAAPVSDAPRTSDGGVRALGSASQKLIIPG